MAKEKLKMRGLAVGAAIFIVALMVVSIIFVARARKTLHDEKANYLQEISLKSAINIENQVNGMFSTIKAISTFIGGHEDYDMAHSLPILKSEAINNVFKRMGIIDMNGMAHTTDDYEMYLGDREYYLQALAGNTVISDRLIDKMDMSNTGNVINVLATPIRHGVQEQIVSVLFATQRQQDLSQNISMDSFDGKGFSYIINSDGAPVLETMHPDSIKGVKNIFDEMRDFGMDTELITQLVTDVAAGENGSIEYARGNVNRHMCYAKINISDWYILSTVPSNAISGESDALIVQMSIMVAIIIIVVIAASIFMMVILKNSNKRLSKIAFTDKVTGYSNWHKFEVDAKNILTNNPDTPFAMVTADISKFKVINDVYGHERGNEVLVHVANTINNELHNGETFSRTSSDNFNILMHFETDEKLCSRLQSIFDKVENYIEGYKIDLAMGIYSVPDNSLAINMLSDRATISKIIAKKNNDVFYHFFKDENRLEMLNEKEIENSMQSALDNGEFEVYLQPKVCVGTASSQNEDALRTAKIVGAEALTRWNKSGVGLLSPAAFVPLFEKNGFICKMDLYVFEQVCMLLQRWKSQKIELVPISVNISRVHLANNELPQILFAIAQKYEVDPSLLEIELTESAVYSDVQSMIKTMSKIKEFGFKLSIDDFGSGYSSLGTLKDLPADFVKLDKSFLDQAKFDVKGEKIIECVVSLSNGLGLSTIAEGVETFKQMAMLKKVGCEIAQGFWFSRPICIAEFEKKLQLNLL